MENKLEQENDFERLDLSIKTNTKKWSIKLIVITIIFAIIFLLSPIAYFNLGTSIPSFLITLGWLVLCIVLRKKYKVLPLIIVDVIMLIANAMVMYSHIIMISVTQGKV